MSGALAAFSASKLLGLFSGSIGYIAVAAGTAGGTYYVVSRSYETQIARLEARQSAADATNAQAALSKFALDAKIISDAAAVFQTQQQDFRSKLDEINSAFEAAKKASPLPASCQPDPVRMRSLEAAISAANRAISPARQQPGKAVPAADAPKRRKL